MRKLLILWMLTGLIVVQGEALAASTAAIPSTTKSVSSQPVL